MLKIKEVQLLNRCRSLQLISSRSSSVQVQKEIKWEDAKPLLEIPGPKNAFQMIMMMKPGGQFDNLSLSESIKRIREVFGTIAYFPGLFGRKPMVFTYLPEDIEKVHRLEGKYPYRTSLESIEYFRQKYKPELYPGGAGLTVTQGQDWYEFRSKVQQILMQPKSTKLYVPKIDEVAMDFIDKMRTIRDAYNETPSNFFESLTEWALESVGIIALDKRLGLIENPEKSKLCEMVKNVFEVTFEYDIRPSIWRYIKTPKFYKVLELYENNHKEVSKFIDEAIENYERNPTPEDQEKGILEKLLLIDENIAKTMAEDMLGAGVDTTASSVTSVLYCLAKNPDKQEILRKEINTILPEKHSLLSTSSFNNIPYLRAVIKEAMRLHPVVSGNLRSAGENLVLQGYQIPKGHDILLPNSLLSLDEANFKQSTKFIPERWLKDNTDPQCPHAKDAHPFTYLPFGFGSRSCIGRRFAELEIEVLISRILKNFRVEWHHEDLKTKSVTINLPEGPLKFRLIDI